MDETASDLFLELLTCEGPGAARTPPAQRGSRPLRAHARLLVRDASRRREAPVQRSGERDAGPQRLGALRTAARGLDAALVQRQQLRAAGPGGARALPPAVQWRAHAARRSPHGRADPRGRGTLREAAARSPGRGARSDGRLHQPDPEHGDQPRHRRAAGRRRAALPGARAGADPRLLPLRAARGAGARGVFSPGDGGLGAADGGRAAARARRGPDLGPAPHAGARRHAHRRRDRDADLGADRGGQRDHEPRRPGDDPDAAPAPRAAEARARRSLARAEGRERDHALRLRRAGRAAALRGARLRAARADDPQGTDADALVRRREPRPGRVRRPRPPRPRARRARPARVRQRPALLPRREPRAAGDGRDARRGARHRHAGLARAGGSPAVPADGAVPAAR